MFADIVAYRDIRHAEPFVVVEVKKKGAPQTKGVKQAESYARNLGAEYHVWSNWTTTKFFKTARYIDQSTPVGNIPTWAEGKASDAYLTKDHVLPPFRDEEHLRSVVKNCHDKIFFNLGHDPAKSFDELMKVLCLKMYDERNTPNRFEFAVLPGQSKSDVAKHIRKLFDKATKSSRYRDVFTTRFSKPGQDVSLDLDDDAIFYLVTQFQSYSLVNTTSTLEGVDIKGTVFERMVGSTFRDELGAYFTPRKLVEFCVSLVDPESEDSILDPSCGSGGFLIMAIKHMREKNQRPPALPVVADSKKNLARYKYLEVGGVDARTGKIIDVTEHKAHELPSRAKHIVRSGMVLLPNHRNSIAAKRSPVLVPEEYDGIVCTSRFIPLRCKVPPAYVYHVLNLDIVKEKTLTTVTGGSSTEIKWEVVRKIRAPEPPNGDYDTFLADVMELESKIKKHRSLLEERSAELSKKFESLFL